MALADFTSRDPRAVLGVSREATAQEITTAYRRLALKWHPDKQTDQSPLALQVVRETFDKISEAYDRLRDEPQVSRGQGGALDPAAISNALQRVFEKSKKKASSRNRNVVGLPCRLAAPIRGFTTLTTVAGDGNCALYVVALGVPVVHRGMLWPARYDIEPFLAVNAVPWWVKMGEKYREGSNDGDVVIAAAAILRSRLPEDKVPSPSVFEFAHSIDDELLGVLGVVLSFRFVIHVQVQRQPPHTITVGTSSSPTTTIDMLFRSRGGGHYDLLSGFSEAARSTVIEIDDSDVDAAAGSAAGTVGTSSSPTRTIDMLFRGRGGGHHDSLSDLGVAAGSTDIDLADSAVDAAAASAAGSCFNASGAGSVAAGNSTTQPAAAKRAGHQLQLSGKRQRPRTMDDESHAKADSPCHAGEQAPSLDEYLQHESEFQSHAFAAPQDDFVFCSTAPVLNEAQQDQQ